MPTTLNPTGPLCGLRYTDRPLLELHFREDPARGTGTPSRNQIPATPLPPQPRRRIIAAGPGRNCTGWPGRCGTPTTS
jgi:hypothetical protein